MPSDDVDIDKELLPFLSGSARYDLKLLAIKYFVGVSGTPEGVQFISSKQVYVDRIIELACDNVTNVVKEAIACLVNVASGGAGAQRVIESPNFTEFLDSILNSLVQRGCALADPLAMLLSNITRLEQGADAVIDMLTKPDSPTTFDQLVQIMCFVGYNERAELHFLAPFLANLSQVLRAREYFLDKSRCVIQRLFPFTQHPSEIRRQAVATVLKNCCFETGFHGWLLSPAVDILPHLLLPLAGPEEFDEDDMLKLPADLQYLEPDKTREPIALIRATLVEALTQLCATADGRKYMRDHNAYIILREYHQWETDANNDKLVNALIQILIGEEPSSEFGTSNLKEIKVPEHLAKKFEELNADDENTTTPTTNSASTTNS